MAHFTGLKELQNHPHKAGFDIGGKNVFTAKVGELLLLKEQLISSKKQ